MIGERIRNLRIEKNWSQKELGDIANVSYEQISRYETGKSKPQKEILVRIANALGVPVNFLYGKVNQMTTSKKEDISEIHLDTLLERIKLLDLTEKEKLVVTEFLEMVIMKKDVQRLLLK